MLLTLLAACDLGTSGMKDPLARVDARYAEIVKDLGVADRDTTRNRTNKIARELKVEAEQAQSAFFADPAITSAIQAAIGDQNATTAFKGDAYQRRAVISRSWAEQETELETELLSEIESTRGEEASWSNEAGEEIDIVGRWPSVSQSADELTTADRQDLMESWVEHRLAWLDDDLTRLVELRNAVAKREGFDTYWELALYHRGLDPEQVLGFVSEIEELVRPLNARGQTRIDAKAESLSIQDAFANHWLLRRAAGLEFETEEAESWFDADLAEGRVAKALGDLGFEVGGIQIYIGPSRYTRSGAYSFAIKPRDHLAVVVSNDRRWSMWPYLALTHEIGRALWWRNLPDSHLASPVLWEPPSPWFEGFGALFERMVYEPEYAERYIPELPEEQRTELAMSRVYDTIETLTWYAGSTRIEKMLYERPGDWKAISAEAAKLDAELRGWSFEHPKDSKGTTWSSFLESGIMLNYPGYVQNFLYEQAVQATLYDALQQAVGSPVANPSVAPWLIENLVHQVGPTKSFDAALQELTAGAPRTAALKSYLEKAE